MRLLSVAHIILFSAGLFALGLLAFFAFRQPEQQRPQPLTIGIVQYLDLLNPVADGFKPDMEELGYKEGQDILYLLESSNGNKERLTQIADVRIPAE